MMTTFFVTRARLAIGIITCLALTACDGSSSTGNAEASVNSVVVDKASLILAVGATDTIVALPKYSTGGTVGGVVVSYSSDRPAVATVSQTGVVRGIAPGPAVITASAGAHSAFVPVSVRGKAVQLTISPVSLMLTRGETRAIAVTALDAAGHAVNPLYISIVSSAPQVAIVGNYNTGALVSTISPGSTVITASVDGLTATLSLTVVAIPEVAGTWDWTETMGEVTTGNSCADTGSFVAVQNGGSFSGNLQQVGQCSRGLARTSNDQIGLVRSGTVNGSNNISFTTTSAPLGCSYVGTMNEAQGAMAGTVSCAGYTGTWQATKSTPVASITLVKSIGDEALIPGGTANVSAIARSSDGRSLFFRNVTWTISNALSQVSQSGNAIVIRANAIGNAIITATLGAVSGTSTVVVQAISFTNITVSGTATCAQIQTPAIYCWGSVPQFAFTGPRLAQMSQGTGVGCGIDALGVAYCWYFIGNSANPSTIPALATNLRFSTISAGGWTDFDYYYNTNYAHACGVATSQRLYCWGDNLYGKLGSDGNADYSPRLVNTNNLYVSVSAGGLHNCAITVDGITQCWGRNDQGQLGNGANTDKSFPVDVAAAITFKSVYTGTYHSCALTADGVAWCWGKNTDGRLGVTGGARNVPVEVSGGIHFISLALGEEHSCGLTASNEVYCWGSNNYGQLGTNNLTFSGPLHLPGALRFVNIYSGPGAFHTCGRSTDSRVYCWGASWAVGGVYSTGPVLVTGQSTATTIIGPAR